MRDPEAVALAREWLDYAREDLRGARAIVSVPSFIPRHACWWAQQSAQKAIKSLLVLDQIEYPFTHDLVRLRELVPSRYAVHNAGADLRPLDRWAVEARYPGQLEAAPSDAKEAVEIASRVLDLVERDFEQEAGK